MARIMLQVGTPQMARRAVLVLNPIYDAIRNTKYFGDVAWILAEAFQTMGRAGVSQQWYDLANAPKDLKKPVDETEQMLEFWLRMLPPHRVGFVCHLYATQV